MSDDFKHDLFLSHSSKDNAMVRDLAARTRGEWVLTPGDSTPAKIDPPSRRYAATCPASLRSYGGTANHEETGRIFLGSFPGRRSVNRFPWAIIFRPLGAWARRTS